MKQKLKKYSLNKISGDHSSKGFFFDGLSTEKDSRFANIDPRAFDCPFVAQGSKSREDVAGYVELLVSLQHLRAGKAREIANTLGVTYKEG